LTVSLPASAPATAYSGVHESETMPAVRVGLHTPGQVAYSHWASSSLSEFSLDHQLQFAFFFKSRDLKHLSLRTAESFFPRTAGERVSSKVCVEKSAKRVTSDDGTAAAPLVPTPPADFCADCLSAHRVCTECHLLPSAVLSLRSSRDLPHSELGSLQRVSSE